MYKATRQKHHCPQWWSAMPRQYRDKAYTDMTAMINNWASSVVADLQH